MKKVKIAIFASGTGSNAVNLIHFFKNHASIEVGFVLSNKKDAPVLSSTEKLGVQVLHYTNEQVSNGDFLTSICKEKGIDWIVLAGYLRLIPTELIKSFNNRMINLHPSLLPKYGGKGMYGGHVHKAVIENKELESGITIHYVNNDFDKGNIIAQFHCSIEATDEIKDLEGKIRKLEQSYLPLVVQNTIIN